MAISERTKAANIRHKATKVDPTEQALIYDLRKLSATEKNIVARLVRTLVSNKRPTTTLDR